MGDRVIAAIVGFFGGIVASLLGNVVLPWIKRFNLSRNLNVYSELAQKGRVRCRVHNQGRWPIEGAMIYLSLYAAKDDVLPPPKDRDAFIKPEDFVPIAWQQLCWSVASPTRNPIAVDILAQERQPFSPFIIKEEHIEVPSEEGWFRKIEEDEEGQKKKVHSIRRCFLRKRKYKGLLKVVSKDTGARYFPFEFDPEEARKPMVLSPAWPSECEVLAFDRWVDHYERFDEFREVP